MKTNRVLAIVFPVVLVMAVPALAWADDWKWNPFAKSKSSSSWSDDDNGWSLWGKKPGPTFGATQQKPSTWKKISSGTASAWNKTTAALTPWKKESKTQAKITGSRGIRATNIPQPQKKTTWYNPTTWFAGDAKADNKPAGSVSEFLNQPRVPY